jgi:alpha-beta hydrolase superfamily lysophospholipase
MKLICSLTLMLLLASCSNISRCKLPGGLEPFPRCQREPFAHQWTTEDGVALPYLKAMPQSAQPRAVVILVTGLEGVTGDYASITHELTRQGYAVYGSENRSTVYGPPGQQGNPRDWKPWVRDLRTFSNKVRAMHPRLPIFWHSHSFGAVTALAALGGLPEADMPAGLILHSPGYALMKKPRWWESAIGSALAGVRVPHITLMGVGGFAITTDETWDCRWKGSEDRLRRGIKVRFITQARKMGRVSLAQSTRLHLPTLALWGGADKLSPGLGGKNAVSEYRTFMEQQLSGPALKIIAYDQGGHLLTEGSTKHKALADIVTWLCQRS